MSSPSPSKSRLARMGGALRRGSTLLSADGPKAAPSTPPARDASPTPPKGPTVAPAAPSPLKRDASQASIAEDTAPSPAKSRLARFGGTLRRNSSLLSGKTPATPTVASSERDSDSTSSKGSAAVPVSSASRKRGGSQGSVDGSVTGETAGTPSKSPLARIGGALRRSSSRTSIKGTVGGSSAPSSKRDGDSAYVKGGAAAPATVTAPKRRASQASLVDKPKAGEGEATASKSKLARIGGVLRRSSSRLSVTRPRTPSITSSDRDTDSTSIKGSAAASAAPSTQPIVAESAAHETTASQDTPPASALPTLAPVDVSVQPESSPRELAPLSPVQENPFSPVVESTAFGPGAFTDEPEELPQPQDTRDLSLSQMEWVDEPEPMTETIAQPVGSSIATTEAVPAPPSSESVASEPLPGASSPEPAMALSEAMDPHSEAQVQEELLDAKPTAMTVAMENVAQQVASDGTAADALKRAEPVLHTPEENQSAPVAMGPNNTKPEITADIAVQQTPTPAVEPTVPPLNGSAAAVISDISASDPKSGVPATTTQNVPPPRSGATWTFGSILAEGISILLRLVWQLRRAGRS